MTIAVRRSFALGARELVLSSRSTLTAPIEGDAELWLARPVEEAVLSGQDGLLGLTDGAPVRVGPGSLWVAFLLPRPDAMVPCDEPRLVNRYVRPLMRALTKHGALAHYFGRGCVSVQHRPVAWAGSAYDSASGRATFESLVAVSTPFALDAWPNFNGKEQGTLESIVGKPFDVARLADAVVASYSEAYGRAAVDRGGVAAR